MTINSLTIPMPDDWHLHLRDDALLKTVLPYTARNFARAIVMPNLKPPVTTAAQANSYRQRIIAALPKGMNFMPLMTAYLTDTTDSKDLEQGFKDQTLFAAKLYPAGATTNSDNGVTSIQGIVPILETMQRIGMPLLIHGELADSNVDFFDREKMFVDQTLIPLRRSFPELKIVLEHVTTRHAVQYVMSEAQNGQLAATITAHHLWLNRNSIFENGFNPHHFCLPVMKREEDRLTLVDAATSGAPMFFAGTDSAPHLRHSKECSCGCAGMFTAPLALSIYTEIFDKADMLDKLEDFLCRNGPIFYGLPVNASKITLEKISPELPQSITTDEGHEIIPFAPQSLSWRVQNQAPL